MTPGYYLMKDGAQHFIASTVNVAAWHRVCDRVLTDESPGYWIDYYHGPDAAGRAHWARNDQTDQFKDADMRALA